MKIKSGGPAAIGFVFMFAALAACGPTSSSAERNPNVSENVSEGAAIAAISVPPGMDDRPLQPGQSGTEYMPNGLPALAPARGINADTMFAQKLSNDEARFKRLENAVADMRREFDAIKPAIIRLSAVESDMEELVAQLQTLVPNGGGASAVKGRSRANIDDAMSIPDIGPMPDAQAADLTQEQVKPPTKAHKPTPAASAAPPPVAPAPLVPTPVAESTPPKDEKPAPEKPAPAPASPAQSGAQNVSALRVGEHTDSKVTRTRIVLDVGAKTPYSYNLDNSEHLLMIELPQAGWSTALKGGAKNSSLLAGWSATAEGSGGTILAVQLKSNARVAGVDAIPAGNGKPFRIVFDLEVSP
ncbi:MAG: hypothetical protein KDJ49_08525 [Alphaproteobacteria bacterium]|nr:hypothetical protein [Alphaproteobacteria bacterium]USO07135.1 MAG: hypothetical protein H6866_06790 [Rhodospirillales bacterium]